MNDPFKDFAKKFMDAGNRMPTSNVGEVQREFIPVKYAPLLDGGHPLIVRFLGGVPGSNQDAITSRVVRLAMVVGDDGKKHRIVYTPTDGSFYSRMINKLLQYRFEDTGKKKKKVYLLEERSKTWWNVIQKNGLNEDTAHPFEYSKEKGWVGRDVFVANVIPRNNQKEVMKDKTARILVKTAKEYESDGRVSVFPSELSSYGFLDKLIGEVILHYGDYTKYDIGIIKTPNPKNPYIVFNATRNPERVDPPIRDMIKSGDLTEEELGLSAYNLGILYGSTSPVKVKKVMGGLIRKLDKELKFDFSDMLEEEIEKFLAREKDRTEPLLVPISSSGSEVPGGFSKNPIPPDEEYPEEEEVEEEGDDEIPF